MISFFMPVVYYVYTHECFSTFSCAPLQSYFLVGAMDISIAYFHPLHHPGVVMQHFDQIRAGVAGNIFYAIFVQDPHRWLFDLYRGLSQAEGAGLMVYVVLVRDSSL